MTPKSIITNVTDIIFRKDNENYQKLCDLMDSYSIALKDLDLEKLDLQRKQLKVQMELRDLEENIVKSMLRSHRG